VCGAELAKLIPICAAQQFFGFSDPLIQHLIARLPGYEDWDSLCARLAPSKSDGEDADQDTRR
jgi:hypothetical protein